MLGCEVITDARALERLAPEWEALLEASVNNEPTLSPLWMLSWWRVFSEGRKLATVAFRDGDRLVGLAPMCMRTRWFRRALPLRRVDALASGEPQEHEICSEYIGVLAEAGREEDVARRLATALGDLGAFDELVFPAMAGDGPWPELLSRAFRDAGMRVTTEQTDTARYVSLPESWEAYLAGLGSKHRYVVRRALRDFERWSEGEHQLHRADDLASLTRGRHILHELHASRWGEIDHAGAFASPKFRAFHDDVMEQLLARDALDLWWLEVRGEPVAALYNIVWNDKVHFYQSGRLATLPPKVRAGIAIHAYVMQKAIAAGRREYDFLGGEAQYKRQLASSERALVTLVAERASVRTRARRAAERGIDGARALRHELERRGVLTK